MDETSALAGPPHAPDAAASWRASFEDDRRRKSENRGIFFKENHVFYETKLRRTLTAKDLRVLRVCEFGPFSGFFS
ncbi:MAG: hypothetical protein ACRDH2_17135, partial [Anaerolineales bacterium]